MKAKKENIAMNVAEVKAALEAWGKLEAKAQEILDAGSCKCDSVTGVSLDSSGKLVDISYWTTCRGESYVEEAVVPVSWFGYSDFKDLEKLWEAKYEADRLEAEKAAKREEKWMKAQQKKAELAELKRLKAKYPEA